MDQNINDSKSYTWNPFLKTWFRPNNICPDVPVDIIRVFFLFQIFYKKVLEPTKTSYHTELNLIDIEKNRLLQHIQKPFWNVPANMFPSSVRKNICTTPFLDAQEPHSSITLKHSTFSKQISLHFYISPKKNFVWET